MLSFASLCSTKNRGSGGSVPWQSRVEQESMEVHVLTLINPSGTGGMA